MFPGKRLKLIVGVILATTTLVRLYDFMYVNYFVNRQLISNDRSFGPKTHLRINSIHTLLYEIQAFNIDVGFLNYLLSINKRSYYEGDLYQINKENKKYFKFGLFAKNISKLTSALNKYKLESELIFAKSKSHTGDETVTSIYIKENDWIIQFSIFYDRNDFYWIGSDDYNLTDKKYFGDVNRAINSFQLSTVTDQNSIIMFVPFEIEQFLYDYNHSRFIECNQTLASQIAWMGAKYSQNKTRNERISTDLKIVKKIIESHRVNYWLAAGTLLGWYRECGIIPHTFDIDFALWTEDFDPAIKRKIFKDKIAYKALEIGLYNDSYELRLLGKSMVTIDLFSIYKINSSFQYNAFQSGRNVYRQQILSFDETQLCSGEFINSKFTVPCNTIEYLRFQYGPNWLTPKTDGYQHAKLFKYNKRWTDEQWLYVLRFYNEDGTIDIKGTLNYLNKEVAKPLNSFPTLNLNA